MLPSPAPRRSSKPKAKGGGTRSSGGSTSSRRTTKDDDGNVVTDFLRSREGRSTVNNVVRGVFDLLKKRK